MRLTSRRDDDADVIRARLRVLLDEGRRSAGWLPTDDEPEELPRTGVALLRRPVAGIPDRVDDPGDDRHDHGDVDVDEPRDEDPRDRLPHGLGRHRAPERTVRVDPGRRGSWALWAAGLVTALAVAGWTWLDRPTVQPAPPPADTAAEATTGGAATTDGAVPTDGAPAASPAVGEVSGARAGVVVSVVGLVVTPGLVTLPEGARVADAVAAAGGLLPEADPASVNLAAVVTDGQQVAVGVPGAVAAPVSGTSGGGAPGGPVDLNAATVADLDALPGIGPVLAQRIVDHRTEHGRFTSVEQLDDVPGIGPAIYAELADLVRV
ncbi:competence protein ComEA [Geodermatophilus bullaregiensis]|uniref:ComEA family DNA-binding protein n=1 Tax=Geodermatophilus bullaregiensis TaxID=1564160 RepID=UPI00195C9147|nr:ComEA family DNA-binding protein [Geodermatophilus bullaregiensis]MBM7808130.1 competence protein ComEA [Geodermatophilus bullaregiensis]